MDTEKSIKEIEAKTYAYLSSILIGPLIIDSAILMYSFLIDVKKYLTYHNDVFERDDLLPFYVNVKEIPVVGVLGLLFTLMLIFVLKHYVKRIRSIKKKAVTITISIIVMIVCGIIGGYISIYLIDALIRKIC